MIKRDNNFHPAGEMDGLLFNDSDCLSSSSNKIKLRFQCYSKHCGHCCIIFQVKKNKDIFIKYKDILQIKNYIKIFSLIPSKVETTLKI